jgi:acetyl esterase/lipase
MLGDIMQHERIYLDPEHPEVYLDTYIANNRTALRDAMLVIPGGGYSQVCTGREGEPIAFAFLALGYNCFVLNYRVNNVPYPAQLTDASRAMIHIRENAEKYNINKNRVFAVGFSAGGHLAGSLGILHADKSVLDTLGISEGDNRPDGVIMCYPVVSALLPTHEPSFEHLTGGTPFADIPEKTKRALSLEVNVDKSSSPAFIWHTALDALVPTNGSLALAQSYVDMGLPVMMKLYPYGPHGLALSNRFTAEGNPAQCQPIAERWIREADEWLKTLV